MAVKVLVEKCIGCGVCVSVCPFEAIDMVDDKAFITEKCTACGACVEECPVEAIEKEEEKKRGVNIEEYEGVWVLQNKEMET